jgi:hypothetical protein
MALASAGKSIVRLYERKDSFERLSRKAQEGKRILTADQLVIQFERQQEDEDKFAEQGEMVRDLEREIDPLREKHVKMKNELRKKAKRFVATIDEVSETKDTQKVLDDILKKQLQIARLEELKLKQILAGVPAAVKSDLFRTGEEEVDNEEALFLLITKQVEIEQMVLQAYQKEVRPPKGISRKLFRRALENNKEDTIKLKAKLIQLLEEEQKVSEKYHWVRGTHKTEKAREGNNIFIGATNSDDTLPAEVAQCRKAIKQVQMALRELIHQKREDPEELRRKAQAAQKKRGSHYVFGSDYAGVVVIAGVLAERVHLELQAACNEYIDVRSRCYWLEGTGTESEKTQALLDYAKSKKKDLDNLLASLSIDVEDVDRRGPAKTEKKKLTPKRIAFFQVSQKSLRRHPKAWTEIPVDCDVYRVPKARDYFYLQATRQVPPLERAKKGFIPDFERLRTFLASHELRMRQQDLHETDKAAWVLTKRVQIGRPAIERERNF